MNRKTFFKSIAALGVAVGIAPKVLAEKDESLKLDFKSYPQSVLKPAPTTVFEGLEVFNSTTRFNIRINTNNGPRNGDLIIDENENSYYVLYFSTAFMASTGLMAPFITVMPIHSDMPPPKVGTFAIYKRNHIA